MVVQERDGGRERCLLWRKECETTTPHRSRRPTATRFPDAGQPTRTALYFGAQGAHHEQVLFDARLGRSTSSCTNTKCSSSPVMSSASWCIVWGDTGTRGTVVLLRCFLLLPCHRVLHSVWVTHGHTTGQWSMGSWSDSRSLGLLGSRFLGLAAHGARARTRSPRASSRSP